MEPEAAVPVPVLALVAREMRVPAVSVAAPPVELAAAVQVPAQDLVPVPVPAVAPARLQESGLDRPPRWARARMHPWVPAPMPRQLRRESGSEKDTRSATALETEPETRGSGRRMGRVLAPGPASAALRGLALVTVPGIKA